MKITLRIAFAICLISFSESGLCQIGYWQQQVDYSIHAKLDTTHQQLVSQVDIDYTNASPDRLDTIYFHLWANAFSNKSTHFADQLLRLGMTDFYFAKDEDLGGYEKIKAQINGNHLDIQYIDKDQEIAYLIIPGGLPSQSDIKITFEYTLRIPSYFSRLGFDHGLYNMVAWYPKPAVYDDSGWHTFPYLAVGEFFSEYGTYQVVIDVPAHFEVAHSGIRSNETIDNDRKIIQSKIENAHDYAWFAHSQLNKESKKITLSSGKVVEVNIYKNYSSNNWIDAMKYTENILNYMSNYMGDYPYHSLSIVQGHDIGIGGAMEYPSIKIIKGVSDESALEYYLAHEIAHAWFYAALGSNEREEPYFDEGLATFLEQKYNMEMHEKNYYDHVLPAKFTSHDKPTLRHVAEAQISRHMHQPLDLPAEKLSALNYGLNAYQIGSTMIAHIESLIGATEINKILAAFYQIWKFKHPRFKDLIHFIEEKSGLELDGYQQIIAGEAVDFGIQKIQSNEFYIENSSNVTLSTPMEVQYDDGSSERRNIVPNNQNMIFDKKVKSITLDPDHTTLDIHRDNNIYPKPKLALTLFPTWDRMDQKEIYLLPLVVFNRYDGLMLGSSIFNSTIPAKNLKWNLTPQFGLHSKNLVGQGWISYDVRPTSEAIRKLQYRLGVKSFTFINNEEAGFNERYIRIDPAIILHHQHSPASKIYSKTSFRQLLIQTGKIISDESANQYISRITHNRYNFDVLEPSELKLELEYNRYDDPFNNTNKYLKFTLEYTKGFAFAKGKYFETRFFGSGFLINNKRESSSFNNGITLGSIALFNQGFTDYAYDEYFIDRQSRDDFHSRQIGFNGGQFKDALGSSYALGQSNNYALAFNFKSHLPFNTPKILPFKAFFDVGYTSTKSFTSDPLTGKILYSGGLMLEYADGLVSVYLPLIGSSEITDIYKSEDRKLLSKISFSIDLHRFNPWDLVDDYNF